MNHRTKCNGVEIAYDVRGSGPPVLWIQGCGVQGNGWLPQIDAFSDQFTCIWFDNRGIGQSSMSSEDLTVDRMADDACQVIRASGYETAHVVGHSLGGLIAIDMALRARAMVRSLALLCTFSGGCHAAPLSLRMIWLGIRTQIGTLRMRRMGFLRLVTAPGPISDPDSLANRMGHLFGHDLATQPPVVKKQLACLRSSDHTSRLSELRGIPTMILSAGHDPIAPRSAGQILQKGIPGSEYVEIADASHAAPITHTEFVNQHLQRHFARVAK